MPQRAAVLVDADEWHTVRAIRRVVAASFALLVLGACVSTTHRVALPLRSSAAGGASPAITVERLRAFGDERPQIIREKLLAGMRREAPTVLAISGGADAGAFGAGVLNGWTRAGDRPEFTLVTGVSTGALIAPFAFLGEAYDEHIEAIYTGVSADDIYRAQPLGVLFGSSLTSTEPLSRLIDRYVTPELLSAVAVEHDRGRRLVVVTTNLDAQRPVLWNMGRIARLGGPAAEELFEKVLLASASIPTVFPPVLVQVSGPDGPSEEMHVDGAVMTQFLVAPEALIAAVEPEFGGRRGRVYVLVNNLIEPEFEIVEPSALAIAQRAFSSIVKSHTRSSLVGAFAFARRANVTLEISFIGRDFPIRYESPFNPQYMIGLYEYGLRRAEAGTAWSREIPAAFEAR